MIASLPWLRAMLSACLMTALGITMHAVAGGSSSFSVAVAPVFLLSVLVARGTQGRSGSFGRLATLLALGQVAVHVAMSPMSHMGAGSMSHVMGPAQMAVTHGGMLRRSGDAYGPKIVAAVADSLGCLFAHPGMLAAHVAAAAAVGWWLAAGERLSVRAVAVLSGFSAQVLAGVLTALRAPTAWLQSVAVPVEVAPAAPIRQLFLVAGTSRRGPPALR